MIELSIVFPVILWLIGSAILVFNKKFQLYTNRSLHWLESQHSIIKEHPDYNEELLKLDNEYIPKIKEWENESAYILILLLVSQWFNISLIITELIGTTQYFIYSLAAALNAAAFVSMKVLYIRKYTISGICAGVSLITTSIKIYNDNS